jgi:hypothetical protein
VSHAKGPDLRGRYRPAGQAKRLILRAYLRHPAGRHMPASREMTGGENAQGNQ